MAGTRIKDLAVESSPVDADLIPLDSAQRGTRAATVATLRAALTAPDDVFEDFADGGQAWSKTKTADGAYKSAASLTALGFPSRGALQLYAGTGTASKAMAIMPIAGFVLGANKPIVHTWRYAPPATDDQCQWAVGISNATNTSSVAWFAVWSGGVRTYRLATENGGVPTYTDVGPQPAGTYFTVRMTTAETGTTVEIAVGEGAFTTLGTAAVAPDHAVYVPYAICSKDTGSGARALWIDSVRVSGSRAAVDSGASTGSELFDAPGPVLLSTSSPAEIADATPVAGTSGTASASNHVHAHGNRGGGALHALGSTSATGFAFSTPTSAQVWVDSAGSDSTGTRGDPTRPFLTLAASLAVAVAGDVVRVGPGTFAIGPFTTPQNVTIAGCFPLRTNLQYTAAADNKTLVTMDVGAALRHLRVTLLSDATPRTNLVGVSYGGTITNAFLEDVHVIVDNSNAPTGTTVTGVLITSTGIQTTDDCLYNCAVNVNSPGTGKKRGILMTGASATANANANAINVDVIGTGSSDVIGVEQGSLGMLNILTSRIGVSNGADISNTNAASGSMLHIGGATDLRESSCNGYAFTPSGQVGKTAFLATGSIANGTRWIRPGSSGDVGTEGLAQIRISRAAIVMNLSVRVGTAPGGTDTCIVTLRKNGSNTALTVTVPSAGTAQVDSTHAVEFASGDLLSIQCVDSGSAALSDVSCTIDVTGW